MYLSENLKKKYMDDFNENVLKCEKEFWKLDEGLRDILIEINKSPSIQTLYSKKFEFKKIDNKPESYIQICYESEDILNIFKNIIIPDFVSKYNVKNKSNFYYSFPFPENNQGYEENQVRFGLGCIDDKDYYRINSIRMNLESYYRTIHDSFWEDIHNKLKVFADKK